MTKNWWENTNLVCLLYQRNKCIGKFLRFSLFYFHGSVSKSLAPIKCPAWPEAVISFLIDTGLSETHIKAVVSFNLDQDAGCSRELLVQLIRYNIYNLHHISILQKLPTIHNQNLYFQLNFQWSSHASDFYSSLIFFQENSKSLELLLKMT
jgi:hypothetical protein